MEGTKIIARRDLMNILDGFSDKRIVYVCAPAGYGKSVCIRQWLERGDVCHASISLGEYDNNPAHFCRLFCSALRMYQPKNKILNEIVLHPAFESAPDEFTLRAIDALPVATRAILVIDDLHYINNEEVLRYMFFFLKRLPPGFQIILISRHTLPASFSEWLGREYVESVTEKHLRFSSDEILLLYEKSGRSVSKNQIEEIHRITGGWAIAVNAFLLSGSDFSAEDFLHLDDFIRLHIWERWDKDTREFMIKTAVLHELIPSLCDEITGCEDSETRLENLVKQNAFISLVKKGVFQYHHLFRDFLRKMLNERGKDFTRQLLEKAGYWFLSRRDFYGAMDYFIACENEEGIARCFGLLVTNGQEYFLIEKLVPLACTPIIQDIAEKFPYIYSILSWAAFNEGRACDMAKYADLYYQRQAEIVRIDPRLVLNIVLVRLIDFRNSLSDLAGLAEVMPTVPAGNSLSDMGVSLGILNQNMPLLHRGTRDFSICAAGDVLTNINNMRAAFGGLFGDQEKLLAETVTAGLLYEQGHLDKAISYALSACAQFKKNFSSESKFCAIMVRIQIHDSIGNTLQADRELKQMEEIIEEDRAYYLSYNFSAFATRRKLAKGDTGAAREWLQKHGKIVHDKLDFYRLYGHLTTCRAHIVNGNYSEAIILLTKVLTLAQIYERPLDIIEAQVLLSVACWKRQLKSHEEAILHLEQAILLAYQFGYTQIFINEGADLSTILQRVQKRSEHNVEGTPPASFTRVLNMKIRGRKVNAPVSKQPEKSTSYTDKQKMVMNLMCEGNSYQKIAENMGIKFSTVRSHITLIYKKLNVTNLTDALVKIQESGILDD